MSDFHLSSLGDVYDIPQPKQQEPNIQYVPQYIPVPVPTRTRLNRIDTMMNQDNQPKDPMDPMLPSLWWIFTYMGLAALTAIGIRSSSK